MCLFWYIYVSLIIPGAKCADVYKKKNVQTPWLRREITSPCHPIGMCVCGCVHVCVYACAYDRVCESRTLWLCESMTVWVTNSMTMRVRMIVCAEQNTMRWKTHKSPPLFACVLLEVTSVDFPEDSGTSNLPTDISTFRIFFPFSFPFFLTKRQNTNTLKAFCIFFLNLFFWRRSGGSRLSPIPTKIGLFCKRVLQNRLIFCKRDLCFKGAY